MDFELTREQRVLQEELSSLITAKFPMDYWEKKDGAHEFPSEFWAEMAKQGYLGLGLPEDWAVSAAGSSTCASPSRRCAPPARAPARGSGSS